MRNYKPGDRVILGKHIGNWSSAMNQYVGKKATLMREYKNGMESAGRKGTAWQVDLDSGYWQWEENYFDRYPCEKVKACIAHKQRQS
jgi:hypothetical protein